MKVAGLINSEMSVHPEAIILFCVPVFANYSYVISEINNSVYGLVFFSLSDMMIDISKSSN